MRIFAVYLMVMFTALAIVGEASARGRRGGLRGRIRHRERHLFQRGQAGCASCAPAPAEPTPPTPPVKKKRRAAIDEQDRLFEQPVAAELIGVPPVSRALTKEEIEAARPKFSVPPEK